MHSASPGIRPKLTVIASLPPDTGLCSTARVIARANADGRPVRKSAALSDDGQNAQIVGPEWAHQRAPDGARALSSVPSHARQALGRALPSHACQKVAEKVRVFGDRYQPPFL